MGVGGQELTVEKVLLSTLGKFPVFVGSTEPGYLISCIVMCISSFQEPDFSSLLLHPTHFSISVISDFIPPVATEWRCSSLTDRG